MFSFIYVPQGSGTETKKKQCQANTQKDQNEISFTLRHHLLHIGCTVAPTTPSTQNSSLIETQRQSNRIVPNYT